MAVRGSEVWNHGQLTNFKLGPGKTITFKLVVSKTSKPGERKVTGSACICGNGRVKSHCFYCNFLRLMKFDKLVNKNNIFTLRGKNENGDIRLIEINSYLAKRILVYSFNKLGLRSCKHKLHGYRKGGTQFRLIRGYSVGEAQVLGNWASRDSMKPYLNFNEEGLSYWVERIERRLLK